MLKGMVREIARSGLRRASPGSMAEKGGTTIEAFRHDAMMYSGRDAFAAQMTGFIRNALEADEHILVMVSADKIDLLRESLAGDAELVGFRDMVEIGRNPARIIPAWREFFDWACATGRAVRGIGEPISASRTAEELVESQRHEELINLAFADTPGWLLCPYDTSALRPGVIDEALAGHPAIYDGVARTPSATFRGEAEIARPFDDPLPEPPSLVERIDFELGPLSDIRHLVEQRAIAFGLDRQRAYELMTATGEIATNSMRYGGGGGTVRIWLERDDVVCEITDGGRIADPLAGRARPTNGAEGGLGLWLVNQLCDLVQIRSMATRTIVRLHKSLRP
jgi:anti-sigma regulatory factor (Ser/Thr protein kinase)